MRIALLVVVAFLVAGCASGLNGTSETTGDITGTWVGTATRGGNVTIDAIFQAQQSGSVITGTLQVVGHPELSGALTGTRNGNVLMFTMTGGGRGNFFVYGNGLMGDVS